MDKLKLIKSIVFILTFLLILGSFSLIMLIFKKSPQFSENLEQNIKLEQPYGSYIKDFKIENENLYILTSGGGLEDRIVIFNTTKGKQVSVININK